MNRAAAFVAAAIVLIQVSALLAQSPDLSGTWQLDPQRSQIDAQAPLFGLIRAGAPGTLHITQPANGTLVVESQINESQSRIYRPAARTSTPVVPSGTISMTSRWEGRTLVSDGSLVSASAASTGVNEIYALSADGRTLSIDVMVSGSAGQNRSRLVYVKTAVVPPCQQWPTPCKP
jgi:hypothetical protein